MQDSRKTATSPLLRMNRGRFTPCFFMFAHSAKKQSNLPRDRQKLRVDATWARLKKILLAADLPINIMKRDIHDSSSDKLIICYSLKHGLITNTVVHWSEKARLMDEAYSGHPSLLLAVY